MLPPDQVPNPIPRLLTMMRLASVVRCVPLRAARAFSVMVPSAAPSMHASSVVSSTVTPPQVCTAVCHGCARLLAQR
jgi:hypothetical protein